MKGVLDNLSSKNKRYLGEHLVKHNLITREQLRKALKVQQERARRGEKVYLGNIIVELGYTSDEAIARILASKFHVPYFSVEDAEVTEKVINTIPRTTANRYKVFPLKLEDNILTVAMMNPADSAAVEDLNIVTGKEIKPVMIKDSELRSLMKKVSKEHAREMENFDYFKHSNLSQVNNNSKSARLDISAASSSDASPAVQLLNKILSLAIQERANDIHIEPQKDRIRIRFRIDGVILNRLNLALDYQEALVSRVKVLGNMDITDSRTPQDGRISTEKDGEFIDIRAASMPSYYGERVTLRLLFNEPGLIKMTNLGMENDQLNKLKKVIRYPFGCILICGPTGSGKSTTLYSALSDINDHQKNIMTIEDPIERVIDGISQVQYNKKAGITFTSSLPSMLRNHPDVIMVGEIRDSETGSIATQAALTGHLVMSTIHASDSSKGILHLMDMGVKPYLVESSLTCVISQRLLRRLCISCRVKKLVKRENLLNHIPGFPLEEGEDKLELYEAGGCALCDNTGYVGRTGVFEFLFITDKVRNAIKQVQSAPEINRIAVSEGMLPLRINALKKVKAGISSLEEFRRVFI